MQFGEIEELGPEYTEIINALIKLQREGLFPLPSSGSITLHYNEEVKLSKIVPSPWIDVYPIADEP